MCVIIIGFVPRTSIVIPFFRCFIIGLSCMFPTNRIIPMFWSHRLSFSFPLSRSRGGLRVFIDQPSNFKLSNVPIVYYKMCIIFPQSGNAILTQNIYSLFVKSYYSRLPFCEKSLPNVRWNN